MPEVIADEPDSRAKPPFVSYVTVLYSNSPICCADSAPVKILSDRIWPSNCSSAVQLLLPMKLFEKVTEFSDMSMFVSSTRTLIVLVIKFCLVIKHELGLRAIVHL